MCDFCGLRQRERGAGGVPPVPGVEGSDEGNAKPKVEAAKPKVEAAQRPRQQEDHPSGPTPAGATAPCARLVVRVLRGEGLLPMDTVINPWSLSLEHTLDAFVKLRINEEEPFAETEVRWKSPGDPAWDQSFSVDITHPKSYLVLFVCDDDPVLRKDSMLGYTRSCGFVEIPLWVLPRQLPVSGWFALSHPDTGDSRDRLADRQVRQEPVEPKEGEDHRAAAQEGQGAAPVPASAGRLRLELLLETTLAQEVSGHMRPAPQFARSLPALDLPRFLGHVEEVKRLLVQRLLIRPILVGLYAISWQSPALSAAVLCWHWLLCYCPRFIWATVWLLLLLCFWHEIPPQGGDGGEASTTSHRTGIIGGTGQGIWSFASHTYEGTKTVLTRPLERAAENSKGRGVVGAVMGGAAGLVQGTAEGAVGLVTHTGQAVVDLGMGVGGGIVGTLSSLRSPGLAEFQHMIRISPALRDIVRSLQRPTQGAAEGLQAVDDLFYLKDARLTSKVVGAVGSLLLLSVISSGYMGVVSGYLWLVLGSLILMARASFFSTAVAFVLAVVAVATKPKAPFSRYDFFEGEAATATPAEASLRGPAA